MGSNFRRRAGGLAALLLAAIVAPPGRAESSPFATFDATLDAFLTSNRVSACVAAIGRGGTTVHERAVGFADPAGREPLTPRARFRIASVSKPVTAAVVRELEREGLLNISAPVERYLAPPAWTAPADDRWQAMTVQHLLDHRGGWDRGRSGDPMFRAPKATLSSGQTPATPTEVVRWVRTLPLDFAPGATSVYANVGYCVLGRVIEAASGTDYFANVRARIAEPCAIRSWTIARRGPGRDADEVWYDYDRESENFDVGLMDAHGGLVSTAADLCRFMGRFRLTGERRPDRDRGRFAFFGSLPGTTAITVQRPDGLDFAVLLNKRDPAARWHEALAAQLDRALDADL